MMAQLKGAGAKGAAPAFKDKPKFVQDPTGRNLMVQMRITGDPKPDFEWTVDGKAMKNSANVKTTITEEKGGVYLLVLELIVSGL